MSRTKDVSQKVLEELAQYVFGRLRPGLPQLLRLNTRDQLRLRVKLRGLLAKNEILQGEPK